jgi:hypothetical protein
VPSTLGGLLLFVVIITPGFIYQVQRRRHVSARQTSVFIETSGVVLVSVLTNLIAIGVFAVLRWRLPTHTPNVGRLFHYGWEYVRLRPGYLLLWLMLLMGISCIAAIALAAFRIPTVFGKLGPVIQDISAWYHTFDEDSQIPEGTTPFVGVELNDGAYITGYVAWFSTEPEENPDRDIVLGGPMTMRTKGGTPQEVLFPRLILSAKDIQRIWVSYQPAPETTAPAVPATTEDQHEHIRQMVLRVRRVLAALIDPGPSR